MRQSSWKAISPTMRPSFSVPAKLWISARGRGAGGPVRQAGQDSEGQGPPTFLLPVLQGPFQGEDRPERRHCAFAVKPREPGRAFRKALVVT